MPRSSTTWGTDTAPAGRGRARSFKSKILHVIQKESLLSLPEGADKDQAEYAFLEHLAVRAFTDNDQASAAILRDMLGKMYPTLKATCPEVEFDLPEDANPAQKANFILQAISKGQIPPDVGAALISAAKDAVVIETNTELKERIEKLEAMLNERAS